MPYQDLPNNFEKDYHSVWVDAPNSLFDPEKAEHMYNDFLDELEYAEGYKARMDILKSKMKAMASDTKSNDRKENYEDPD